MTAENLRFRRIMLKLSGEALMGDRAYGIDPTVLKTVAKEIHELQRLHVETAIVVGGGNIFRGINASEYNMGRASADYMGMLATVMNSLALGEVLNSLGSETRVMSAIDMPKIAEPFIRKRALQHLEKGRVVIFSAGTGNPFFSTDTAATLRAMEIDAAILLKATKVDGVYEGDPEKDPSSKLFEKLTYQEYLNKELQVMDMTAVTLAMDQNLPIIVFNLRKKSNIINVVLGEKVGTLIAGEET